MKFQDKKESTRFKWFSHLSYCSLLINASLLIENSRKFYLLFIFKFQVDDYKRRFFFNAGTRRTRSCPESKSASQPTDRQKRWQEIPILRFIIKLFVVYQITIFVHCQNILFVLQVYEKLWNDYISLYMKIALTSSNAYIVSNEL